MRRKTVVRDGELNSEAMRRADSPKWFFMFLVVFMASTSFLFGMMYLARFYWALLGWLPWTQGMKELVFPLLGGGTAVLLLEGAYVIWRNVKLNMAGTDEQIRIAQTCEMLSLSVGVFYSVIGLATTLANGAVVAGGSGWVTWASVGSFVVMAIFHYIQKHRYENASVAARERLSVARSNGWQESERLVFEESVKREAIIRASAQADRHVAAYAARLAESWSADMMAGLPDAAQEHVDVLEDGSRKGAEAQRKEEADEEAEAVNLLAMLDANGKPLIYLDDAESCGDVGKAERRPHLNGNGMV